MTRIVKFSECVEYMIKGPFGSDMKKSLYVPKGDNTYKVYIQGNAIQQDEALGDYYVSEEYFHDKLERFEVHPGDYIITCDGTLGKFIKLSDSIERGVISSSLLLLKLNEEIINDKYFELLWEHTMLATLASQARNACLVHLPSAKAIGDLEVELPEMGEQLEIAEKAFSVKRNIAYREKQQELLDDLIKARFVELFGNPVTNEKGWNTSSLNDVCDGIGDGLHGTPEYDIDGEYPFINGNNLMDGSIEITPATKMVDEKTYKKHYIKMTDNAILLSINGTLGKLAFYRGEEVMLGKSACYCNLKPDINREFVYGVMQTDAFSGFLESNSTASTIKNVGLKAIRGFNLIMPPKDLQNEYVEFAKQVDKSKVVEISEAA